MSDKLGNRAKFPNAAMIVDMFRAVLGDGVKLVYAKENGRQIGNNAEPKGCLNVNQYLRLGQIGKLTKEKYNEGRKTKNN